MKKNFILFMVLILAMGFIATNSFAASAKATAKSGNVASVVELSQKGEGIWTPILTQKIKTANMKDLFVDVSMECGLITDTTVASKKLVSSLAMAEAIVQVRVTVDKTPIIVNADEESAITFARRKQELIAQFAGLYDWECIELVYGCLTTDELGNPEINSYDDTCDGVKIVTGIDIDDSADCYEYETLQLVLDTMTANSFNFIATDVPVGEHTIRVEAKLEYDTKIDGSEFNAALANAILGNASVTIEEVRLVKDDAVIDF